MEIDKLINDVGKTNVRVGCKILGSIGNTHIYFLPYTRAQALVSYYTIIVFCFDCNSNNTAPSIGTIAG
jgi:hypothetical protein